MKLTERINFRQPKYMLPAIVYLPLLGASYFIFALFDTKVAEKKDANMQTTEYLNPNLPQAHITANVKHWHGAAQASWFAHLAFEIPGEDTSNEWLEAVSDEEYNKIK